MKWKKLQQHTRCCPVLEYKDILGNILYAGVWNRFDDIQTEKKKKQMNLQEEQ